MGNHLKHLGYYGSVEYSSEDNILHGKIIGISDLVTYEAESVEELQKAFEEAVTDYLTTCEDLGKEPNKYYKGVFNVRTSSDVHAQLSLLAERNSIKLNEVVNRAFDYLIKNEDKVIN